MESSFKSYSLCELSGHESSGSMPAGKTKNKTTSRRRSVAAIYLKKLIPRVKLIKTQTLPVTKTTKIEEPEFKNQLEKLMISKQTVLDRVHQFLLNENSRNEAIKLPEDASTSSSKSSPSSKSSLKTSFETEEESSTKELRELNISKSSSHRTSDELPLGIIASHSKASNSGPKTDIIKNLTTNKMVVVNPEIHDRILESPKINFSISCKNEDIILQDKLVPTSVIVKTIQNDHNIQKSVNTAISQINSSEITNIKHTDSCSPQLTEKKTLDDAKRKKYFFEATNNATEVDNVSSDSSVNSICARECLQKGVEAHQNDDMINSARWFEQSAKKDGGCGMGMLMWALSLRHGWGCEIDKVKAYGWLQMAAENLLLELNHLSLKRDSYANFRPQEVKCPENNFQNQLKSQALADAMKAVSSELLLTVYELGQCIMHGWGCEKDKALAFQYYKVAAIHGDPDAQKELAYCYEVGRGVKKSYKEAAKFYRMAFNQGNPIMGYQWVWKEKYNFQYG